MTRSVAHSFARGIEDAGLIYNEEREVQRRVICMYKRIDGVAGD